MQNNNDNNNVNHSTSTITSSSISPTMAMTTNRSLYGTSTIVNDTATTKDEIRASSIQYSIDGTTITLDTSMQQQYNDPPSRNQEEVYNNDHDNNNNNNHCKDECKYYIGQLVSVESRTYPGMNQPGGIGRITSVVVVTKMNDNNNFNNDTVPYSQQLQEQQQYRVSVKYVLDARHEKNIDSIYVKPFSFDDPTTTIESERNDSTTTANPTTNTTTTRSGTRRHFLFRNRKLLLGRCTYCGSLRTDCQSCDMDHRNITYQQISRPINNKKISNNPNDITNRQIKGNDTSDTQNPNSARVVNHDTDLDTASATNSNNDSDSGNSSSDSEQYDTMIRKRRKEYLRYKRLINKIQQQEQKRLQQQHESLSINATMVQPSKVRRQRPNNNTLLQKRNINRMKLTTTLDVLATIDAGDDDDKEEEVENYVIVNNTHHNKQVRRNTSITENDDEPMDMDSENYNPLMMNDCDSSNDENDIDRRTSNCSIPGSNNTSSSDDDDDDMDKLSLHQLVALQSSVSTNDTTRIQRIMKSSQKRTIRTKQKKNLLQHINDASMVISDERISNYNNDSATGSCKGITNDDTFIQPEGNANVLPDDVEDKTSALSYPELITFFDTTYEYMESISVPNAKQQLQQLEREYKSIQVNNTPMKLNRDTDVTSSNNADNLSNIREFYMKCNVLHDELIQKLVRNGYDQCQLALRKLTSKKFYKQYRTTVLESNNDGNNLSHQGSIQKQIVPYIGSSDDVRGLKLDMINQTVEDILSKFRFYSRVVGSQLNDNEDNDSYVTSSKGSNEDDCDSDNSDRLVPFDQQMDDYKNTNSKTGNYDPLDMHPYASKKRREKIRITNVLRQKKKKMKRCMSLEPIEDDNIVVADQHKVIPGIRDDSDSDRHSRTGSDFVATDEPDVIWMEKENVNDTFQVRKSRRKYIHQGQVQKENEKQIKRRNSIQQRIGDRMGKWLQSNNIEIDLNADDSEADEISKPRTKNKSRTKNQNDSSLMESSLRPHQGHKVTIDGESNESGLLVRPKYKRKNMSQKHSQSKCTIVQDSDDIISSDTIHNMKKLLFSSLCKLATNLNDCVGHHNFRDFNLISICEQIHECQSVGSFRKQLNAICDWFENCNTYSISDASLVFQTMYQLLTQDEVATLQDLVSSESSSLDHFLCVLGSILKLIRLQVNLKLTSSDGIIYDLFGTNRCKVFIDFCMLQLVDTVMSLFQPKAWDLRIDNVRNVLHRIEFLRNELNHHCHLTERICVCILQELPPQEWRCVRDGKGIFISSVNPNDWESFLSTGQKPNVCSTSTRFSSFQDCIPRCEVDAMWCLLAFLSGKRTSELSQDSNRWGFISQLLLNGSLSKSKTLGPSPPEIDQVEAAIDDMSSFTDLIKSGAMGTLPRRDNVVLDVIQRALSLQEDHFLSNECTIYDLQPSTQGRKDDNFFPSFEDDTPHNVSTTWQIPFRKLAEELYSCDIKSNEALRSIFLPSSYLLRCSLALLLVWKKQIPPDKVKRIQCMDNAVKAFIKEISTENATINDQNTINSAQEQDAFSAAFDKITEKAIYHEPSNILFRKECVAYITMVSSLLTFSADGTLQVSFDNKLVIDTWELLADERSRSRQQWISSGTGRRPLEAYNGESFRLLVSSKAMTCLWILLTVSESADDSDTGAGKASTMLLILSCLLSCIDCACDLEDDSGILSIIVQSASFVLETICKGGRRFSDSEGSNIANMFFLSDVLQRIFHRAVNTDDRCFQNAIAFIQVALPFSKEEPRQNFISSNVEPSTDDDPFDEIDDEVLASINIGSFDDLNGSDVNKYALSIYELLTDSLEFSKPSNRTAFTPTAYDKTTNTIGIQGIKLINKYSDRICDILVNITTKRQYSAFKLWKTKNSKIRCVDADDNQYFRELDSRISRKICLQKDSFVVQDIVQSNYEYFLFCALEVAMDHNLLRKVPSCNLDRIAKTFGSLEEEQGFTELLDFRNGVPTRLNDSLAEVKDFCGNLGHILVKCGDNPGIPLHFSKVGRILSNFSNDSCRSALVPSIEQECFNRFYLLRSTLREVGLNSDESLNFERVAAFLLRKCSIELLHLLERVAIKDRVHLDVQGNGYSRSKLFEAVASFIELHVTLVTEILSCQMYKKTVSSINFNQLYQYMLDDFVSSVLGGKNLVTIIQKALRQCLPILNDQISVTLQMEPSISSNYDLQQYFDMYRNSFLRRTREFTLIFAVNITRFSQHPFRKYILALFHLRERHGVSVTQLTGQSFTTLPYYGSLSNLDPIQNTLRSPLEVAIDVQYAAWEKDDKLPLEQIKALRNLKMKTLSIVADPHFFGSENKIVDSTLKISLFRFIEVILNQEQDEKINYDGVDASCLDIVDLCSIVKQVGSTIRNEVFLGKSTVDESLLISAYTCIRSVLLLPADTIDPKSIGWLVDWACPSSSTTLINSPHSDYIWYACCWIRDIGELILNKSSGRLTKIRSAQLETMEASTTNRMESLNLFASWVSLTISTNETEELHRTYQLNELDQKIFPTFVQTKHNSSIVNRYRTLQQQKVNEVNSITNEDRHNDNSDENVIPFEDWKPSTNLYFAIRQVIDKVKFATPSR